MAVAEHYEKLLSPVYSWIYGGRDAAIAFNKSLLGPLVGGSGGRALDLGAGSGFQSIPLAELGYDVVAVDMSEFLLEELNSYKKDLPIKTFAADIASFEPPGTFALAVCMGDTLPHLPDLSAVERTVQLAANALQQNGSFIVCWRDVTTIPEDTGRFIPVRSDAMRVFTCFLEDVSPEKVRVTDILHTRTPEGDGFGQRASSYFKLRLSPETVERILKDHGLSVTHRDTARGMQVRVAVKN